MLRALLLSLALLLSAEAVSAQSSATAPALTSAPVAVPYVIPAPPGRLVDIGGRRLHLQCKGDANGPTVIFEAGLSQYTAHSTYGKAQDQIASFARVCTYDRAGLGWSDFVAGERTHQDMIDDLHKLVIAAELDRPLILVGHSVGGLLVRRYASQYPDDVAGVVLVDATPVPYLYAPGMEQSRKSIIAKMKAGLKVAKDGVPVVPLPADTSPDVVVAFLPGVLRAVQQEYEAIDLVPAALRQRAGYGTLGDTPLAVIRRGKTASPASEDDQAWRKMQEAITSLSTNSFLLVAEDAGHVIPYDQPQIVADAVRRILDDVSKR